MRTVHGEDATLMAGSRQTPAEYQLIVRTDGGGEMVVNFDVVRPDGPRRLLVRELPHGQMLAGRLSPGAVDEGVERALDWLAEEGDFDGFAPEVPA